MQDCVVAQMRHNQYIYRPITTRQIRVAEIYPGEFDDPIAITLHHECFLTDDGTEAHPMPYEALSYVWGSKENPARIIACADNSELEITRNLSSALKHLRYRDRSRFMWADALCIDQKNEVEKGPYVAMMGSIYRRAARVVAWLGEEENNSDEALSLLKWIGDRIEVDFHNHSMRPSSFFLGTSDTAEIAALADRDTLPPIDEGMSISIHNLFCRPWFDRLWIRQEIYLANQSSAIVACGNATLAWTTFRKAWACLLWKPTRLTSPTDWHIRMNSIQGLLLQPNGDFFQSLRAFFGYSQCEDPRDRIFAILSLDSRLQDLKVVPDYTSAVTHMDVYQDITRRYLDRYGGLRTLSECEMLSKDTNPSTPTWVPDWSTGNPYLQTLNHASKYASACLMGPISTIEANRLRVIAFPLGKIGNLHLHPLPPYCKLESVQFMVRELAMALDLGRDYRSGGSSLEAYASTLVMGDMGESYVNHLRPWSRNEVIATVSKIVSQSGNETLPVKLSPIEYECLAFMSECLFNRVFLTTKTGYMGLAPQSTVAGDEVCVILGCKTPMVLRPTADGHCHQVVGPCYVEGFDNGEAILGSLPKGIKRKVYFKKEGPVNTFGAGEIIDPRIKGLVDEETERKIIYEVTKMGWNHRLIQVDMNDLIRQGIRNAQYLDLV
ncbi:heterokaryon incompatibility protein-domain-containing protein [Nemania sp. FL0031]|nr:heterokaryon incompatibility protein-domain-containing protein [Nemania sp. FL0031]